MYCNCYKGPQIFPYWCETARFAKLVLVSISTFEQDRYPVSHYGYWPNVVNIVSVGLVHTAICYTYILSERVIRSPDFDLKVQSIQ